MQVLPLMMISLILIVFGGCVEPNEGVSISKRIYEKSDISELQGCALSKPCSAVSDSCVSYDGSSPRCYPSGREYEIVGCTDGNLTIEMSDPARASCQ